jgi:hypothetical protein
VSAATSKRSDALKAALAASIQTAAKSGAEVTVFGAGRAPEQESGVGTHDSSVRADEERLGVTPPPTATFSAESEATEPIEEPARAHELPAPAERFEAHFVAVPQNLPKGPTWEKRSITLENSDLDILERFHASARDAGVKMRRGGNPSLFVRAALRAFDELSEANPQAWAQRLAAVLNREGV